MAACLWIAVACACVRQTDCAGCADAVAAPAASSTLRAFRIETAAGGRWGFRTQEGRVAIAPRFEAVGDFAAGQAPVRLEGEYVFIDTAGAMKQPLRDVAATQTPPLPSPAQSLEQYIEVLGAQGPAYRLVADPSDGETSLRLEVRRLAFGALDVREIGWEGEARILILPNASLEHARAIVARLLSGRPYKDVRGSGVFEGDVDTYELSAPESSGDFLRVREHRGGGVEIIHTRWAG